VKIDRDGTYRFSVNSNNYSADPDMVLYQTTYPHKDIALSSYEGQPTDTLMVSLKKGNYLLDVYDASFNNSCYTVSLKKMSGNIGKSSKLMAKPRRVRNLPNRQYY